MGPNKMCSIALSQLWVTVAPCLQLASVYLPRLSPRRQDIVMAKAGGRLKEKPALGRFQKQKQKQKHNMRIIKEKTEVSYTITTLKHHKTLHV